ncbi:hypothetical protein GCM10028804_33420 [Larkinella terrae]
MRAATDTARVNRSLDLANEWFAINYDSTLALAQRTRDFARRIAYPIGEAKAWMQVGRVQSFKGNYNEAYQALHQAEVLFLSQNAKSSFGRLYLGYGVLYLKQNLLDSAAYYFNKAIPGAQGKNDGELLTGLYANLAVIYQRKTNYPLALANFQKGLQLAHRRNDLKNQAGISLNIGTILLATGDSVRAERNTLNAIRFAKQAGNRYIEMLAIANLGENYEAKKQYARAYQLYLQAAELARQLGENGTYATHLMSAAWMLAEQKKYGPAEALNRRSMAIADSLQQPFVIYDVYTTMGSILKEQGKYALALPYYEQAFRSLGSVKQYNQKSVIVYANLALCYEKTGQYLRALRAFQRSATLKDSLRSQENIRKVTEQNLTFEFTKKQAVAKARAQAAEANSRIRQGALGGGLIVALLLMVLAFFGYRSKQRANTLLHLQKEKIEQTLTQLKATQNQLIQAEKMASLGELTAGIAHEIQNPLNFVNNFSDVSTELVDELKEGPFKQVPESEQEYTAELLCDLTRNLQKITQHGRRADSIVKGMLEHSRSSTGERKTTDLNALSEEYLKLAYHGLRAKDKNFNAELATHFDPQSGAVEVVPQDIGRVLLNLYNNAFYAVQEKRLIAAEGYQPMVTVSTHFNKGQVEIRVKDNGIGMPESVKQKIFQPFFTTKPTGQGTGLGLSLSYDIVTKGHGGSLEVETQPGEGTEMIVRLPS